MVITGLILTAGASLTACQKKAVGDDAGFDMSGSGAARTGDKFGTGFGKASRAPPNSEPANVSDSDVVPVSLTAEPTPVD